jgi:hypothetical protein
VDDADFAKQEPLGKTSTPSVNIYSNYFAGTDALNEWFVALRLERIGAKALAPLVFRCNNLDKRLQNRLQN